MQNLSNFKNSNISYQITIDLELQKGEKLSTLNYVSSKCRTRRNKIKKLFSEVAGLKYTISPVYNNLVDKPLADNTKSSKSSTSSSSSNNKTQKNR
jgi:hypothetical protein